MQEFETIATFTLPSELIVAKTKLESEGIECRVLDELTVQSYNFLSNAVGGVKLQVPKSEFDKAYSILLHGGFIKEDNGDLNFIERLLGDSSTLKKAKIFRLVFFGIFGLVVVGVMGALYINMPTDYERLTGEKWCLDHLIYENEVYYPNTLSDIPRLTISGYCSEFITFDSVGNINIPGFNSRSINGQWSLVGDQIIISKTDTLEFVFDGSFDFEMRRNELILNSGTTEMICIKPPEY